MTGSEPRRGPDAQRAATSDDASPDATSTALPSADDERVGSFGSAMQWSVVMNVGRQFGNLGVTFVLAWMLGPEAFGVIALALVFVGFVQMLMQQGMGAALVQRPSLRDEHTSTGFWAVLAAGTALTGAVLAASSWWASVNDEPQLAPVVRALAPLLIVRGLIVVPEALLRRRMRFKPLAMRTNISVLAGGAAGLLAAALGADVWALVVQQITLAVVEMVIVWAAVDWRPRLSTSSTAFRELATFSWKSGVASFAVFANARLDAVIISLYLGTSVVGLYRFASRLVDTVLESISGSIRAVSLPELARMQHEPQRLAERVLFLHRLTASACLIPLTGLAAAGPAVIAVLGEEWEPAAGAVALLCVAGVGKVVGQLVGPVLQSADRPGRFAVLSWVAAALSAGVLLVGTGALTDLSVSRQVTMLAVLVMVLHAGIFLAINLVLVSRTVGASLPRLAATLVRPLIAAAVGYAVGWAMDQWLLELSMPALGRAVLVGTVSGAIAAAAVFRTEPEARRIVMDRVRRTRSAPATTQSAR